MNARLLLLALVLAAAGVQAQTKKELAAKVVQLQQSGIEQVGRSIAGRTAQQVLQVAGQGMQRLPADKREAVGREIQADVRKFHEEVEPLLRERALRLGGPMLAPLYEERFTEDELKQVIAWLESSASRKFAQVDSEFGNLLAEKVMADTRPTVEGKLKALEATLAKRLGLPAAAGAPASSASSGAAPKKK